MKLAMVLLTTLVAMVAQAKTQVAVVVEETGHQDYVAFLAGRDPLTIRDYGGEKARRTVVEYVLLQQALALGGMEVELVFQYGPNAARKLKMVQAGLVAMEGNTLWHDAVAGLEKDLFISDAIIRSGEFEAGFYTHDGRQDLIDLGEGVDLAKLRAVSSSQWVSDWRTLSALPLDNLYDIPTWSSMKAMVKGGRADFLLAPFQSSDDLSFGKGESRFLPIPNIKLGLVGSRHFVISRHHPDAQALFQALQEGLTQLRKEGRIVKAMTDAGLFNQRVSHWRKLN